jgi:hypothetical protein
MRAPDKPLSFKTFAEAIAAVRAREAERQCRVAKAADASDPAEDLAAQLPSCCGSSMRLRKFAAA